MAAMTNFFTNRRERIRFLRFCVVGAIGAIVDFGVANLLHVVFGAPLVLAGTISFICAILSNFTWNRFWTYPDSRSKPIVRQLIEFSLVSIIGLVIRVPVLALLERPMLRLVTSLPFRFRFISPEVLAANLTLAVAVIIVMFWNFFVNRFWTYGDAET
jgi:putative flippase GtrA